MNFGGSRLRCEAISGHGQLRRSVGHTTADLEGCREGITGFALRCGGQAHPNGPVQTSALGTQLMRGPERVPKLALLGLRVSFDCAEVLRFTVEGFLVGHLDHADCDRPSTSYSFAPVLFAHGYIYSEPAYDIYVASHRKTYKIPVPWQMGFRSSAMLRC